MATAVELPPPRSGCYLTDGERLMYVLDASEGQVLVEDCGPDPAVFYVPVREVLGWRRVLPA